MGGVLSLALLSSLLASNPAMFAAATDGADGIAVSYNAVDSCTAEHTSSAWDSMLRCRPRPTLVELPLPSTSGDAGSILQVIPGHVMVDRCSGSCDAPSHSCLPTLVENTTMEVMAVQTTYSSGAWNTLCSVVSVEKHLSCECSCRVRPEHCDAATQNYDANGCQCKCKNQVSRTECLHSGKHWDDSSCSCLCPRRTWRPCSTGFSFDYRASCGCVRVHAAAAAGGALTALVAVFAALMLALSALVVHLRRRQEATAQHDQRQDLEGSAEADVTTSFVESERSRRDSSSNRAVPATSSIRDRCGSQ